MAPLGMQSRGEAPQQDGQVLALPCVWVSGMGKTQNLPPEFLLCILEEEGLCHLEPNMHLV